MAQGVASVPRLEMRGVRKRFGATLALDGIGIVVEAGEVHALLGENGAGKSTLVKVLSGAVRPDEGDLLLDGVPYRPRNPHDGRRAGVGMIYQELSLAPHLTVEENIFLGMEPVGLGILRRGEIRRRAREALEHLGHDDLPSDAPVGALSLALRQVVEVARALAVGCRVLVLDEPTSSLAGPDVERLFGVIARLRAQGLAVVYISHFIEEAMRVADRYTVLRDGRRAGEGTMASATVSSIAGLMVGRKVDSFFPRSRRAPGETLLRVGGLDLRRGEVVGLAGLVGSGRTELLKSCFDPSRSWARGIGLVSEDRKGEGLALGLSVADNVTLTRLGPFVSPSALQAAAEAWIERLGIRCRGAGQRVAELSGGNQQKVALARLLHHEVDVLLLDEPTRGIDLGSKAEIYRLIDDLVSRRDPPAGVLMASSYLPELLGVCDRIAVMRRGRLGAARPVGEWDERGLMIEATGAA